MRLRWCWLLTTRGESAGAWAVVLVMADSRSTSSSSSSRCEGWERMRWLENDDERQTAGNHQGKWILTDFGAKKLFNIHFGNRIKYRCFASELGSGSKKGTCVLGGNKANVCYNNQTVRRSSASGGQRRGNRTAPPPPHQDTKSWGPIWGDKSRGESEDNKKRYPNCGSPAAVAAAGIGENTRARASLDCECEELMHLFHQTCLHHHKSPVLRIYSPSIVPDLHEKEQGIGEMISIMNLQLAKRRPSMSVRHTDWKI